jgi:predicted CopG family antitoxin
MTKTVAISDEAYKKVIARKGEMEKKDERSVPMAEAVDALLEGKK